MGLLTIVRKQRLKEREMRVLMLGLDNAGKTSILKRIEGNDISQVSPTLGFNIKTLVHKEPTYFEWLSTGDVGGQKSLRPYWRNYFEITDAVVWVVDSTDRARISDCKEELDNLLVEERLAGACILVFANKQDISGSMASEEIRDALQLPSLTARLWNIIPCSAQTGDKLISGFDWIVDNATTGGSLISTDDVDADDEDIAGKDAVQEGEEGEEQGYPDAATL